jgi:hypothetical protein
MLFLCFTLFGYRWLYLSCLFLFVLQLRIFNDWTLDCAESFKSRVPHNTHHCDHLERYQSLTQTNSSTEHASSPWQWSQLWQQCANHTSDMRQWR